MIDGKCVLFIVLEERMMTSVVRVSELVNEFSFTTLTLCIPFLLSD